MHKIKHRILTWCREVAAVVAGRRHPGRQMQINFPLPLPDGPAPVPDWLIAFSLLGEVEADDPDEPTKTQVDKYMTKLKSHKKEYGGALASPPRQASGGAKGAADRIRLEYRLGLNPLAMTLERRNAAILAHFAAKDARGRKTA